MAKKATTTKKKKKGGKRKSSSNKMGINTSGLMGMAAGIYISEVLLPKATFFTNMDPKMQSGLKLLAGQLGPSQAFVKNIISDGEILNGAGNAMSVMGMSELMKQMNMMSGDKMGALKDDDVLAIALKGIEDISTVSEDVLSDDLNTVNADVLGDDDDEPIY